ncbi:MAG: hypothetical protein ABT940_07955 [Alphaproteobacteria bacterium]
MESLPNDRHAVLLSRRGGRYFAHLEDLPVHGCGETVEAALAEVERRYEELSRFAEDSGVDPRLLGTSQPRRNRGWAPFPWKTAAAIVICFGFMMVPLSYALSSALERAVANLDLRGGAKFWQGVQEGLIRAADPRSAPSQEEQEKTTAALRALAQRFRPYVEAVGSAVRTCPDRKEVSGP